MVTAIFKVIAASGTQSILQLPDPLLLVSYKWFFLLAGWIELLVSFSCFFFKRDALNVSLIIWFSSVCLVYRIGIWFMNGSHPCPCLGNLTDAIYVSPQTAETAMKIILAYLFLGSYTAFFWLWLQKREQSSSSAIGAASL